MMSRSAFLSAAAVVMATPAAAHYTDDVHVHATTGSYVAVAVIAAIPVLVTLWEARKARAKR